MQDITQMISTVGFPIFSVIACGYFIYKTTQQTREDNNSREDKMYEQLNRFSDAINSLNETLKTMDMRVADLENKKYDKEEK